MNSVIIPYELFQKFQEWLEDQEDIAEIRKIKKTAINKDFISLDELKKDLGLNWNPKNYNLLMKGWFMEIAEKIHEHVKKMPFEMAKELAT